MYRVLQTCILIVCNFQFVFCLQLNLLAIQWIMRKLDNAWGCDWSKTVLSPEFRLIVTITTNTFLRETKQLCVVLFKHFYRVLVTIRVHVSILYRENGLGPRPQTDQAERGKLISHMILKNSPCLWAAPLFCKSNFFLVNLNENRLFLSRQTCKTTFGPWSCLFGLFCLQCCLIV